MKEKIAAFFKVEENKTRFSIEIVAGITTFLTMSYIIFLQPLILTGVLSNTKTGMDYNAVMVSVCIVAAFGSILMGLLSNYPIALAPGMGENFFFVTLIGVCASIKIPGVPWQVALGVVFVSGIIFLLLTVFKVRELIMNAVSENLQYAMACGIGLFIALLGLKNGGLIVAVKDVGFVLSSDMASKTMLIFSIGLLLTASLQAMRVRGAIIIGILVGIVLALCLGKVSWAGIVSAPPSVAPVFAKMDLGTVFKCFIQLLPYIIIFTFMDVFDTMGTLFGIGAQADLIKDGKLPNAQKAMTADSIATAAGAFCGNSTVTAYIESATGVQYGGRTGLTAIVTGFCFLLAIFFSPLVKMVGTYKDAGLNPITAPALVIVGAMMMKSIKKIKWDDFSEAIPAFLILIGIPLTFSIADGLMLGFIAYPIVKLCSGKGKEASWVSYVLAVLLVIYVVCIKTAQ